MVNLYTVFIYNRLDEEVCLDVHTPLKKITSTSKGAYMKSTPDLSLSSFLTHIHEFKDRMVLKEDMLSPREHSVIGTPVSLCKCGILLRRWQLSVCMKRTFLRGSLLSCGMPTETL